jgi:hypothetical protein
MALALVQHAAPPDRLHLWIGVADHAAPPRLAWKLDGRTRAPDAVTRPLAPVLAGPLAPKARTTVFTGCFEFAGLAPGGVHEIEIDAAGERLVRRVRTLPDAVPAGPQERFNVLLLSCFHRLEDKPGTAGMVLSQLKVEPHLTLFMGDQVYLDLPTGADFPDDEAWLADKFQNDYLDNWFGHRNGAAAPGAPPAGFPQLLALAPGAFLPDDHEFWNNYPAWSAPVQNSWTPQGRARWTRAAEAAYRGFQQSAGAPLGAARVLDVAPLSILLLDTRSGRTPGSIANPNDLLGAAGRQSLRGWVDGLVRSARTPTPRFGMLVAGQSFFRPAAGPARGAIADYEFADYAADYEFMVGEVERLTRAGLPLILATGDVHWGRVLSTVAAGAPDAPLFEVISSPTSLVSTVVVDRAKEIWGGIKGLLGEPDPWPRHGEPDLPPPRFGSARQYGTALLARDGPGDAPATMRGNHAFMLRFARVGGALDVAATCHPLASDDAFNARAEWSTSFQLRPPRRVTD